MTATLKRAAVIKLLILILLQDLISPPRTEYLDENGTPPSTFHRAAELSKEVTSPLEEPSRAGQEDCAVRDQKRANVIRAAGTMFLQDSFAV
jgi:hypothetical protein